MPAGDRVSNENQTAAGRGLPRGLTQKERSVALPTAPGFAPRFPELRLHRHEIRADRSL